jgi:hypothetical protein
LLLYQFLKPNDLLLRGNKLLAHPLLALITDYGDSLLLLQLLLLLVLDRGFCLTHHPRRLGVQVALIFEFGPFLHRLNLVQAFNFLLGGQQLEVSDKFVKIIISFLLPAVYL